MKKFDFKKIREINWKVFLKQNRYSFVSVLMLAFYFYATFFAIAFIVKNIRHAFAIDEQAAERSVTTFDMEGYTQISQRFGNLSEPKD